MATSWKKARRQRNTRNDAPECVKNRCERIWSGGCGVSAAAAAWRETARQPVSGEVPAFRDQGEIRYFPVHGGSAQSHRYVRSQAGVETVRRPETAGELRQGGESIHRRQHAAIVVAMEIRAA